MQKKNTKILINILNLFLLDTINALETKFEKGDMKSAKCTKKYQKCQKTPKKHQKRKKVQ